MKQYLNVLGLAAAFTLQAAAQEYSPPPVCQMGEPGPWQVRDLGQDHTTWEQVAFMTNASGRIMALTNSYVELETSCRYWDGEAFQETREEIDLVENGAIAQRGPHKVGFASGIDPAMPYNLEVLTPDDKRLRFKVVALYLHDFHLEQYVMIADVKESRGMLTDKNQVVYPDAFSNLKADIRYTYTKAGIEQDIILREHSDSLVPELYGFDPSSTRLLCYTEVVDPPNDVQTVQHPRAGSTGSTVAKVVDFGAMKIGHGSAFRIGPSKNGVRAPVQKHWIESEGRSFIVEEVSFLDLQPMLDDLQASNATLRTNESRFAVGKSPRIPGAGMAANPPHGVPQIAQTGKSAGPHAPTKTLLIAKHVSTEPGVVIDFNLQSGSGRVVQGDTTYLVTGVVNLTNAVLEGGAVLKYNTNAQLNLYSFECKTAPYRPLVCTAQDDNSVGGAIAGSTGTPTNTYASRALALHTGGTLDYVHIRFAREAVYCANNDYAVNNAQIIACDRGFHSEYANFTNSNVLMSQVLTNFSGVNFTGLAEHLTADKSKVLAAYCGGGYPYAQLTLMNSLTSAITNGYGNMPVYLMSVRNFSHGSGVFQTVGAGAYYLVDGSTNRNAGITNLSASALASIRIATTFPPALLSGSVVSNQVDLYPTAQRDVDLPDIGYHYSPVDYFGAQWAVTNSLVRIHPGTVISRDYTGYAPIWLADGSSISCLGTPNQKVVFVSYPASQEMPVKLGSYTAGMPINPYRPNGVAGSGEFRFTDFISLPGEQYAIHLSGNWIITPLSIIDCAFYNGVGYLYGSSAIQVDLGNNLFKRVNLDAAEYTSVSFWNNLFHHGAIDTWPSYPATSVFIDNVVLNSAVYAEGTVSNNAYINSGIGHTTNATEIVLTNFFFASGPLGDYYQVSTNLINKGSRSAGAAGLYHFTTTTNQVKEGSSTVDIGLHYVATDGTTTPLDYDGDGVPDWQEDVNGDGSPVGDPTSWTNYNSLNGLSSGNLLQVFTPLKP